MKRYSFIFVLALLLSFPALAAAYQVALEASASKPEVGKGETFTYKLSIIEEGEAGQPVQLSPPDFTGFDVTGTFSSSSLKVIEGKARRVTDQEYRISSSLPGEHTIPPAKLVLTDPKTGARQEITSNPVKVVVLEKGPGVMKGLEEDIRDIKSPKTFMDRVRLIFYAIAAIVVLVLFLLIGLAIYLVKRKKKAVPLAAPVVSGPIGAREKALAALARAESLKADQKVFYSVVTDAVRVYLSESRGIPAVEATTAELLAGAEKAGLPQGARDRLGAIFYEADLVKFAKHTPTEEEKTRFIERARALVSEL
jgi:hypothetical protein